MSREFPTVLARNLAESCDLLVRDEPDMDYRKAADLLDRMIYFQRMSVTCKFEDCVAVYYGMTLTDEQLSILKLIHRTTKPFIAGFVVDVLMDELTSRNLNNRDFAEAVKTLIEQCTEQDGGVAKKLTGIVVKSTRRDAEITGKRKEVA